MKKALKILKKVFVWVVFAWTACMLLCTVLARTTVDRVDRSVFGYRAFTVLSDATGRTNFSAGDLILVKDIHTAELQEGDIVTYCAFDASNNDGIVTDMIRRLTTDAEGKLCFSPYGTAGAEEAYLEADLIVGKYQLRLPGGGTFFGFLQTTLGFMVCVLLPALLLVGILSIQLICRLRRRHAERLAELQAEQERLEAERADTERLKNELLVLKAQMFGDGSLQEPVDSPEPTDE